MSKGIKMKKLANLILLLASLTACMAQAQPLKKVVYGTVSSVTLSQGVIIAAKSLGFFKDEGLDVQIVEFNGTASLLPQMTAKRVQIGFPNPDVLIISRQPGKDRLPLKFFYNATRKTDAEFAVLADSPIKELSELKGKKIGVGALSFGNIPITRAMFKGMHMEAGKDYDLVPVGMGAAAFLAFREKNVDALNLFDLQDATLEVQGTQLRRLEMPAKYRDLFANGFIAHEDTIRDDPKMLAGFGRAIAKASVFCEANSAACVKEFWKVYPNQKPAGPDEARTLAEGVKIFNSRFRKFVAFDDQQSRRWGEFPSEVWSNYVTALYEGGQLSTKDIPVESCYTNALVSEFNRFDAAPIVARAKAAQ
jgi:NitT/TauT family transport system substrate-binding protein